MKSRVLWGLALGLFAVLAGGMIAARDGEPAQQTKQTKGEQTKKSAAKKETPAGATSTADDEAAIRASVAAFEKAYNNHDAKAIAALFAPEAQMIDEDGKTVQGREAIEQVFTGVFAEDRKSVV